MRPTLEQIRRGTGCTPLLANRFLEPLQAACEAFEINNPARLSAFFAQIGHESGRLVYVREIWGPTDSQRRYEGRKDLGNTEPGDGRGYLGRGLIQITGRANYTQLRDELRKTDPATPDFVASPEILEQPAWAAKSAAWFWRSRGLNALADAGQFELITRRINGGLNGQADRLALHRAALQAMASA